MERLSTPPRGNSKKKRWGYKAWTDCYKRLGNAWTNRKAWCNNCKKWICRNWFFLTLTVVILLAVAGFYYGAIEFLFERFDKEGNRLRDVNTNGEYIKLVGALIGGLLVLYGLYINNKRVKEQNRQNNISEKAQVNTRFKDEALLLANENTSAILSGAYALHQIAVEASKNESQRGYIKVIRDILCAYLRENSVRKFDKEEREIITRTKPKIVFQTIMDLLTKSGGLYEQLELAETDLSGIDLAKADLIGTKLNGANLSRASLSFASLSMADLSNANLSFADLSSVSLLRTNLLGTNLEKANLTEIDFNNLSFSPTINSETRFKGTILENYTKEQLKEIFRFNES